MIGRPPRAGALGAVPVLVLSACSLGGYAWTWPPTGEGAGSGMQVARHVSELSPGSARALLGANGVVVPDDAVEVSSESIDFERTDFLSADVVLYRVQVARVEVEPMLDREHTGFSLLPEYTCAGLPDLEIDLMGAECDPGALVIETGLPVRSGEPVRCITIVVEEGDRPVVTFLVYEIPV